MKVMEMEEIQKHETENKARENKPYEIYQVQDYTSPEVLFVSLIIMIMGSSMGFFRITIDSLANNDRYSAYFTVVSGVLWIAFLIISYVKIIPKKRTTKSNKHSIK
jgi:hypothetical protein